ncbi:MAG: hypothetical protein ACM3NO_07080, partial [Deltaproteobacteria bacterium]
MQNKRLRSGFPVLRALSLLAFALTAGLAVAGESPRKSGTAATATREGGHSATETANSQDAVKALQLKISEQQAQIDKLTRAVELLTDRLNSTSASASTKRAGLPHDTSVGQLSSLTPVIPAAASSAAKSSAGHDAPPVNTPATTASDVEALRQQIEIQQEQIERLQPSLNQQRLGLDKRTGAAGESQAVSAPSEASSHTSQEEAQHVLVASSASPSTTSSGTSPAQSGGSAGQAAPQTLQLPAALKAF